VDNYTTVKPFCEQIPHRDWNNLWQFNQVCNACFKPQATIIGRCYVVIVSARDPLHEVLRFKGLDEWVVVVDFDDVEHAELGGSFHLFLLTTNTLECKGYQAFYPDSSIK
jgi:hypothetical protein